MVTNTVIDTITVGLNPQGVSASADGMRVYMGNTSDSTVSVINTATNAVVATVHVGVYPQGIQRQSHDWILEETPLENVLAMFDAIREFGSYRS